MKIDSNRYYVSMVDKRTKDKVYLLCSKDEASEIFCNRKDNKRFEIVSTGPEYLYEEFVFNGNT